MSGVAIVGGGIVGAAVAYALARRGVGAIVLEAEEELALGASGTNSGILHTGFDSPAGELETALLLRSGELRASSPATGDRPGSERLILPGAEVPVLRCGAIMTPRDAAEARAVARSAERARANGVEVTLRPDGALEIPGEAVTDPVAYTLALADAAVRGGAEVRTGARVEAIRRERGRLTLGLAGGETVTCDVAINCAGLHADEVARLAGDETFEIYPRKGEFFVFDHPLDRILLPVPTERTRGVLVFPTIDGKVVAGPTAIDQVDKSDWSVRAEAQDEVLAKARSMLPSLEGAEPIASYAGLRPAGRGVNYLIGPSPACPGLVNVAAIRSTGLSASLGIGEHVAGLVAEQGVPLGPERPLAARSPAGPIAGTMPPTDIPSDPWWARSARYRSRSA